MKKNIYILTIRNLVLYEYFYGFYMLFGWQNVVFHICQKRTRFWFSFNVISMQWLDAALQTQKGWLHLSKFLVFGISLW